MSLENPPPRVICNSGHMLRGPDAFQAAETTHEHFTSSPMYIDLLARLSIVFKDKFDPTVASQVITGRIIEGLTGSELIQPRIIKLEMGALTLKGIVAANMVRAQYYRGDIDAELVEPFVGNSILSDLSKRSTLQYPSDSYNVDFP